MDQLSDRQLGIAYWWLTHQEQLRRVVVGVLIALNVGMWGATLFFGVRILLKESATQTAVETLSQSLVDVPGYIARHPIFPLTVGPVLAIPSFGGNREDLVVEITNQNTDAVAVVRYRFHVGGLEGSAVILPQETKLITEFQSSVQETIAFTVFHTAWRRLPNYQMLREDRWGFSDQIDATYTPAGTNGSLVSRVHFVVHNSSAYTYAHPSFVVSLWQGATLVAVNRQTIDALASGEARGVDVSWPGSLPQPTSVRVDPDVDITDPVHSCKEST